MEFQLRFDVVPYWILNIYVRHLILNILPKLSEEMIKSIKLDICLNYTDAPVPLSKQLAYF